MAIVSQTDLEFGGATCSPVPVTGPSCTVFESGGPACYYNCSLNCSLVDFLDEQNHAKTIMIM